MEIRFISFLNVNSIDVVAGRWCSEGEQRTLFFFSFPDLDLVLEKEGICIIFYFNSLLCSIPIQEEKGEKKKLETFCVLNRLGYFFFPPSFPSPWKAALDNTMMMMKSMGYRVEKDEPWEFFPLTGSFQISNGETSEKRKYPETGSTYSRAREGKKEINGCDWKFKLKFEWRFLFVCALRNVPIIGVFGLVRAIGIDFWSGGCQTVGRCWDNSKQQAAAAAVAWVAVALSKTVSLVVGDYWRFGASVLVNCWHKEWRVTVCRDSLLHCLQVITTAVCCGLRLTGVSVCVLFPNSCRVLQLDHHRIRLYFYTVIQLCAVCVCDDDGRWWQAIKQSKEPRAAYSTPADWVILFLFSHCIFYPSSHWLIFFKKLNK